MGLNNLQQVWLRENFESLTKALTMHGPLLPFEKKLHGNFKTGQQA